MDNIIIERQIKHYNYIIYIINEFFDKNIEPLKNFIKHLSKLYNRGEYLFEDSLDCKLLITGYSTKNDTILLYLKYKFLLYIEQQHPSIDN